MGSDRFRALVVDDEAVIRKLIVGALRKQEFECDDAADGVHAAQLATKSRYDVVITDLKMPNKNGHALSLELLQFKNRPLVVVHTGIIEPKLAQDLLTRGVEEIVYKPTDFGILASKVKLMVERRRAQGSKGPEVASQAQQTSKPAPVDEPSSSDPVNISQLNAKLADLSAVLPVSHSALDVYEMTRSDDWKVSQIAAAIQRDASLVIEVLRLANSALYNTSGRQITDLDDAVVRLGQRRVGELALVANTLSAVAPNMLPWMDLELAWKRSMAAGIALESLVELGGHQEIENGLLLSAIMHPLGRVALAMLFPKHYEAMVERCHQTGESLREEERRMFPTSHTEIMSHLLAKWRIPRDVFLPLKFSLDEFSTLARLAEPTRTKAELVKVAIIAGRIAVGRWESWDFVQFPGFRVLQRLHINDIGQIINQTKSDLSKIAQFRPGSSAINQQTESPCGGHSVAYCNLSGSPADLLLPMLPSMGLQPRECAVDQLQNLNEPSIVNCLGAASPRFATNGGSNNKLFVTEQEHCDIFEQFGRTATLPNSYGRFRDALLNLGSAHAAEQVDATSPCCA